MKRIFATLLLLTADWCLAGSLGTMTSEDGRWTLAVTMDQPEDFFVHNRLTTLSVQVFPSLEASEEGALSVPTSGLSMSASMLAYEIVPLLEPKVVQKDAFAFEIEGVKLHVPGAWLIKFVLDVPDGSVAFEKTVVAKPALPQIRAQ